MLARLFLEVLKAFVVVGHLALWGAWMGAGLVMYLLPAFYAAVVLGDRKTGVAVFMVLLVVTGILSFKVKALSRVVDVFHFGGRVILTGMEKMLAEVSQVARAEGEDISLK